MNSQDSAKSGTKSHLHQNALYRKIVEAYRLLNSEWSYGALKWCKQQRPELYAGKIHLEQQINTAYQNTVDRVTLYKASHLLSGWIALVKEIAFHHKDVKR